VSGISTDELDYQAFTSLSAGINRKHRLIYVNLFSNFPEEVFELYQLSYQFLFRVLYSMTFRMNTVRLPSLYRSNLGYLDSEHSNHPCLFFIF
jgi:hypothetical protein